jgi:hypothetical protein
MDALARLAPVARPLLVEVDAALATLGAPAGHAVWRLLGSVGATPADLVAFVAELEPSRLLTAGTDLRRRAEEYDAAPIPTDPAWEGETSLHYATTAAALREHAAGLAGRLRATASYVEGVAAWQQALRDELARALARVLASAQAVKVRLRGARPAEPAALTAAVGAAADIAAELLTVVARAAVASRDVVRTAGSLDELAYRPPVHTQPARHDGTVGHS